MQITTLPQRIKTTFFPAYKLIGLATMIFLGACGGGGGSSDSDSSSDDPFASSEYADTSAYLSDSPYANKLKNCVLIDDLNDSCSLSDLPLLIEEAETPSVDDIMNRVLVSHKWMGKRFKAVLKTYPSDIRRLFGSITSIVIDDDIRPSYYDSDTSTIYLDAAYLWLTNSEKTTITQEDDFRSSFDDELDFVSLARYVDGFNFAWNYYSLEDNSERSIDDIRLNFANLLLHELMHANDFFPAEHTPYLNQNQSIYQAMQELRNDRISTQLNNSLPLTSNTMFGLAEVMYLGDKASTQQKQLSAADVGATMENDGANDDYAYTSQYEDVAMLFSEAMMKYLFDLDRDIAYTNRPGDDAYCDDYIVGWGVRGRIGDSEVKPRAQFVLESAYPGSDFSLFFQNLAAPKTMRVGDSWCDNLAVF